MGAVAKASSFEKSFNTVRLGWGCSQNTISSADLAYGINMVLDRQELVGTMYRTRTAVHRSMLGRAVPAAPASLPHVSRSLEFTTAAVALNGRSGHTAVAGPEFHDQGYDQTQETHETRSGKH